MNQLQRNVVAASCIGVAAVLFFATPEAGPIPGIHIPDTPEVLMRYVLPVVLVGAAVFLVVGKRRTPPGSSGSPPTA